MKKRRYKKILACAIFLAYLAKQAADQQEKIDAQERELDELRERSKDWVFGPIRIGNFGGGGRF